MVEDFLSEQFADDVITSRDVAAALLKLLMQRDFGDASNVPDEDPLADAPRRPSRDGRDGRDGFRQGDRDGGRPRRNDAPMRQNADQTSIFLPQKATRPFFPAWPKCRAGLWYG